MPHLIETAPTGRAKCRGCGNTIAKGDVRLGEAVPNLYADAEGAESTHWYHVRCGAYRRPEAFMAAAEATPEVIDAGDALAAAAQLGIAHHRLARVDQASRAPSARATCRECRTPIDKGAWRLSLLFWQDGRFSPSGYIHAACTAAYFGTPKVLDRVRHFTPALTDVDAGELQTLIETNAGGAPATTGA